MEAGIVGLPNVGKSTLFNALTLSKSAASENYPFCTIEPNEGMVSVPDGRLERITKYIVPQNVIPAALKLVDIAGIVKGASEGEGLGNKFLSHIRQVDAILQVVRCFEDGDVIHVSGQVDPIATRCNAHLESEKPLRTLELNPIEKKSINSFGFLTAKPVLYVANVAEDDLEGKSPLVDKVRQYTEKSGAGLVTVCAKIESEIAELDPEDRGEMLDAVGLTEPALAVLARAAYKTLGLESYFTAGEKEVRAWTIPSGATGPEAAGVIHTDFEKGFIRAEVYTLEDLEEYGSEQEIKKAGKLRVEGKAYVVQDGDICHFRVG